MLADIQPGDEIIMPIYTYVWTMNAFALREGISVFVDIDKKTMNIDESLIEAAISPQDPRHSPRPLLLRALRHGPHHGHRKQTQPARD